MKTGTLIYIIAMGWSLIIYGGITYLFSKKQDHTLLSGFSNRPKEEKEYLRENGYLDALNKLFVTTFWIFFVAFILGLLPIPFAFEISLGVFILVLMIGLVWIQRYEVPHKRKKMLWIMGAFSTGTIIFIVVIIGIGYIDNDIKIEDETFTVTGMYGVEWDIADIETVELMDTLPDVNFRTNGFATAGILKGNFNLEEPYGNGLLLIEKNSAPYLYIETKEDYMIINRKDPKETTKIYNELLKYDGVNHVNGKGKVE